MHAGVASLQRTLKQPFRLLPQVSPSPCSCVDSWTGTSISDEQEPRTPRSMCHAFVRSTHWSTATTTITIVKTSPTTYTPFPVQGR